MPPPIHTSQSRGACAGKPPLCLAPCTAPAERGKSTAGTCKVSEPAQSNNDDQAQSRQRTLWAHTAQHVLRGMRRQHELRLMSTCPCSRTATPARRLPPPRWETQGCCAQQPRLTSLMPPGHSATDLRSAVGGCGWAAAALRAHAAGPQQPQSVSTHAAEHDRQGAAPFSWPDLLHPGNARQPRPPHLPFASSVAKHLRDTGRMPSHHHLTGCVEGCRRSLRHVCRGSLKQVC